MSSANQSTSLTRIMIPTSVAHQHCASDNRCPPGPCMLYIYIWITLQFHSPVLNGMVGPKLVTSMPLWGSVAWKLKHRFWQRKVPSGAKLTATMPLKLENDGIMGSCWASDKLFEDGCVRCQGSEWRDDINAKVNAVFQNDQNRNDTAKLILFQHTEDF